MGGVSHFGRLRVQGKLELKIFASYISYPMYPSYIPSQERLPFTPILGWQTCLIRNLAFSRALLFLFQYRAMFSALMLFGCWRGKYHHMLPGNLTGFQLASNE